MKTRIVDISANHMECISLDSIVHVQYTPIKCHKQHHNSQIVALFADARQRACEHCNPQGKSKYADELKQSDHAYADHMQSLKVYEERLNSAAPLSYARRKIGDGESAMEVDGNVVAKVSL